MQPLINHLPQLMHCITPMMYELFLPFSNKIFLFFLPDKLLLQKKEARDYLYLINLIVLIILDLRLNFIPLIFLSFMRVQIDQFS